MRAVVLADTHIPDRAEDLPDSLIKIIKKSDLVIHAGDFTSLEYYNRLKSLTALRAVLGNIDAPELREHLKDKEIFTLKKYKIGVMHGFGRPENVLDNVKKTFDGTFDLVIYGHTHTAFQEQNGKTIFFNPGSPTDKIFAPYNSYGLVEIGENITTKIVRLEK